MTSDALNRLLHQIEVLHKLSSKRASERRVVSAIRACTREIESLAADDMASEYAREIRIALEGLSERKRSGHLSQTIVGEQIEHLVAYGLIMSVAFLSGHSSPGISRDT